MTDQLPLFGYRRPAPESPRSTAPTLPRQTFGGHARWTDEPRGDEDALELIFRRRSLEEWAGVRAMLAARACPPCEASQEPAPCAVSACPVQLAESPSETERPALPENLPACTTSVQLAGPALESERSPESSTPALPCILCAEPTTERTPWSTPAPMCGACIRRILDRVRPAPQVQAI